MTAKDCVKILLGILVLTACGDDEEGVAVPEGRWEVRAQYVNPLPESEDPTLFVKDDTVYWGFGKYWDYEASDWKFNTHFYRLAAGRGWVRADDEIPPFPAEGRQNATVVTVDGKVYAGFGNTTISHAGGAGKCFRDFWMYDAGNGMWFQYGVQFPSEAREGLVAFVVDGRIAVGGGQTEDGRVMTDFYYIITDGTMGWIPIDGFPDPRYGCVAFVLEGEAYVGCGRGYDSYPGYFVKWNREGNSWESVAVGSEEESRLLRRVSPVAFTLKHEGREYAYLLGGRKDGEGLRSCCRYSAEENNWHEEADFPGLLGDLFAFTIDGRAFVATCDKSITTVWEFVVEE